MKYDALRLRLLVPRRSQNINGVAGFLASGSSYLPRLPGKIQWLIAVFIACLQLRDSEGITPSSLLPEVSRPSAPKPCGETIVPRFVAESGRGSQRENESRYGKPTGETRGTREKGLGGGIFLGNTSWDYIGNAMPAMIVRITPPLSAAVISLRMTSRWADTATASSLTSSGAT